MVMLIIISILDTKYLMRSLLSQISWKRLGQEIEIWELSDYKGSFRSKCRWRRENNRAPHQIFGLEVTAGMEKSEKY